MTVVVDLTVDVDVVDMTEVDVDVVVVVATANVSVVEKSGARACRALTSTWSNLMDDSTSGVAAAAAEATTINRSET